MCEEYPELVDNALEGSSEFLENFISKLEISTQPIQLTERDTAELLFGKSDLSQRGYKQLRSILLRNNVIIPTYEKVRKFCNDLKVGTIEFIHTDAESTDCKCMGIKTNFLETLQCIFSTPELYKAMTFQSEEKQKKLYDFLCTQNHSLYKNFSISKRTIFLRETGDNFRGAGKFPTEQTSFSLLNLLPMANNPYGQFLSTLWRGSEDTS